jgi:hypothetical protein
VAEVDRTSFHCFVVAGNADFLSTHIHEFLYMTTLDSVVEPFRLIMMCFFFLRFHFVLMSFFENLSLSGLSDHKMIQLHCSALLMLDSRCR